MGVSKSAAEAWETRGIYVRLSKRRKARLLEIAKELGHEDSPHRALAAYIGDPLDSGASLTPIPRVSDRDGFASFDGVDELRDDMNLRLDALTGTIAALEERLMDALSRIGDSLAPFQSPISVAGPSTPKPESLAAFLASAEAERGMPIARIALVQASWASTAGEHHAANAIAMGFSLVLLSVDGNPATTRASGETRISGIDACSGLAAHVHAAPFSPLIFACRPIDDAQWSVEAFSQRSDHTLGELLGSFLVG